MNKSELADALASRHTITKALATEIVDTIFNPENGLIASSITSGDKVSLQGFGTFSAKTKAARLANNPKTGVKFQVPAKTVAKFVVGKILKEAVAA